jgi:hypothetical protein
MRTLLAALLLALAAPAAAQEPVRVMVLGTYHFANPRLDVVKTEVADVMTPGRQAEIERIAAALARFRPTHVAVEALPGTAPRWDSLYAAFRAGRHALSRDERQQLGFRVAARMQHPRVHPIDHEGDFPFQELMAYAQAKDTASARMLGETIARVTAEENRRQRELGIAAHLRLQNEPREIAAGHAMYLRLNAIGAGDGYAGSGVVSAWYTRNLRIFANLQRLVRPGERVLVIFGAGHSAILRELVRGTPGMALVEPNDFLPPR